MAKYKVLETSYIDNRIVHAGEVVDYEGTAGENLEAIDESPSKPSKKAAKAAAEAEAARIAAEAHAAQNDANDLV